MIFFRRLVIFVKSYLNSGHSRSIKAKKTIISSFLYRGFSILTTLLLVPATINYLNTENYGIWITISSIIGWLAYFDIGLGNGMRNKFAEAVANGDHKLAKTYVSTTYALMIIIFGAALALFLFINPWLDWSVILNADAGLSSELSRLALVVVGFFCIQIVTQLINIVLTANQEAEYAAFSGFLVNLLTLIFIFLLSKTTQGNLVLAGFACSIAPVIVYSGISFWFFFRKYKAYIPSFKYVKFSYGRNLMNLGVKFFIIQASLLVLFQASNIIIAQMFGPEDVTKFNVAFRYFNVVVMLWWILISPIWSAITEAWAKKDGIWIKAIVSKLRLYWMLASIGTVLMLLFSGFIYRIWVGKEISIPFNVSLSLALYVITYTYCGIYFQFLNGVGIIKLQLVASIISMVLYIPIAVFISKYTGVSGVILANVVFNIINMIWSTVQYNKIINNRAVGIWSK